MSDLRVQVLVLEQTEDQREEQEAKGTHFHSYSIAKFCTRVGCISTGAAGKPESDVTPHEQEQTVIDRYNGKPESGVIRYTGIVKALSFASDLSVAPLEQLENQRVK